MGHEALPVINAPPDVAVDIARRGVIDGHRCPVLEAGDNLGAKRGLLADVPAASGRHLDLICVAEDRVRSALLATHHRRKQMPAR